MISFYINNGGTLTIQQIRHDDKLEVVSSNTDSFNISAGDFITMINWYRYQKEHGNERLDF